MAAFLGNLRNVIIAGFVLAGLVAVMYYLRIDFYGPSFWPFLLRWLHVASGVMWIGLLWYFNFVSTPTMPKIPDELKPALGRFITPAALFWFRWSAMSTLVLGLILAYLKGYIFEALTLDAYDSVGSFGSVEYIVIGIGMWLGIIMWFNVWFIIWPNQQKALNINNAFADLPVDQKAKAARLAGMTSRVNTMLSIPMLFCMVGATHLSVA